MGSGSEVDGAGVPAQVEIVGPGADAGARDGISTGPDEGAGTATPVDGGEIDRGPENSAAATQAMATRAVTTSPMPTAMRENNRGRREAARGLGLFMDRPLFATSSFGIACEATAKPAAHSHVIDQNAFVALGKPGNAIARP